MCWLLDEPTASLDVRHEMEILELLRASADHGMTVFLITHHLDLAARFADRLLLLDRGRVAAEGEPQEVLQEETLERVYEWPISVSNDPDTGVPRVTPLSTSSGLRPPPPPDQDPDPDTGCCNSRTGPGRWHLHPTLAVQRSQARGGGCTPENGTKASRPGVLESNGPAPPGVRPRPPRR